MELRFAMDAVHGASASYTFRVVRPENTDTGRQSSAFGEKWGSVAQSPYCALLKCRIDLFSSPSTIKPVSIEAGADGKLFQSMLTVGGCSSQSNLCLLFWFSSICSHIFFDRVD